VIGPILIGVFLLVLFPIGISLSGAVVAALHGQFGTKTAETLHAGTELLTVSKTKHRL
jgi:hypothetical protein